jgi:hypothetical protein
LQAILVQLVQPARQERQAQALLDRQAQTQQLLDQPAQPARLV